MILSIATLAATAAVALATPAVAAVPLPTPCDARVVVLPGEAPLGTPCRQGAPTSAPAVAAEEPIVVTARPAIAGDPLVAVNAEAFKAVDAVDAAVIEPIADAYSKGLPKPLRKGLSNFFANLREPVVFLNDVLQLRPGRALKTLGRFAVNTTAGIAGLVDVARKKPFKLPPRTNGFANTLGYYGVGPGPFLVVPLLGATTLRDMLGGFADNTLLPSAVGAPFDRPAYRVPSYVVTSLDSRIELDDEIARTRASKDPYATLRDTYLSRRAAEIAALKARGNGMVASPLP